MNNFKVVVTDSPFPSRQPFLDVLHEIDCEVIFADLNDKEDFHRLCNEADGMIVTYADMNKDVIAQLQKCRILARTGVAVNNIAVPEATKKRIYVTNVVTPQIEDVSNHAVTLLLACIKKIVMLNNYIKKGNWDFKIAVPVYKMSGKTLGLAGFGNIARNVAQRVKPFGINVVAFDPYVPQSVFENNGVKKVDFEGLLAESDYFSIHMPLTDETKDLFGKDAFKKMKPLSYIINTSRGGIINEEALKEALDDKKIAGAGLDVLATEFPNAEHPLYRYENVIITPHSAYYSEECVEELQKCAAGEVVRVLLGDKPLSLVNKELL